MVVNKNMNNVDNTCDGVIIDTELRRKLERKREGYHFISDERFEQLTIGARKKGAIILRGGEAVEKHLDLYNAGASSIGNVLCFRHDVTVSEVVEEVYHFEQNLRNLNDDKNQELRTVLNEIDAKRYLLNNKSRFKIPREEIRETEIQLEQYLNQLHNMEKNGYV